MNSNVVIIEKIKKENEEKKNIELINKICHQKEIIKIDDYDINQKIVNNNKN